MRLWQAQGWVELQDLMLQRHGIVPSHTCKQASSPDQMWISPELAIFVNNIAVWDIYPDHAMLAAGLTVPPVRQFELQWHLPGHIPLDFCRFGELGAQL